MRRILLGLALLSAAVVTARAEAPRRGPLYIQPFGGCGKDGGVSERVVTALKEFYGLDVRALPCAPLPRSAYYAPRRRWRAERLAKVAVHEVGHTLGLDHCPTRGCLMEDARGSVRTCDRENDLCPECRRRLAAAGVAVPEKPRAPWRKPGSY